MQLAKKKILASKILKVGKGRIIFVPENLEEIKEAITRQDILDLHQAGAIKIKSKIGRRKIVRRKRRRKSGKVRKKVNKKKKDYVKLTRKLRCSAKNLLRINKLNKEQHKKIKRMIRAKKFRSRRHLNESLGEI